MKIAKQFLLLPVLVLFMATLISCGGNSVDKAIDEFETIVEKYEDLATQDQISKSDLDELQTESEEVGTKFKNLDQQKLTPDQKKRVEELSSRLMKAAFQVGMKTGFPQ